MSKEYFYSKIVETGLPCGERDVSKFIEGRYSTCRQCRLKFMSDYNKSPDPNTLDLSGLKLTDEDLRKMNLQEKTYENVYLQNNNLVHIDYLPIITNELNLSHNKIKKIDLKNFKGSLLYLSNNNIKSSKDIKVGEHTDFNIELEENPVSNSIYVHRTLNSKQIKERKNKEGEKYLTYILPKGTVLFRTVKSIKDFIGNFVGYENFGKKDNNYYLTADQLTYFTTSPKFLVGNFGYTTSFFVLNNDIEVFLGFSPAKVNKFMLLEKIFTHCEAHPVRDQEENPYKTAGDTKCLPEEYKNINIAGAYQSAGNLSPSYEDVLDREYYIMYNPVYHSTNVGYELAELAIYPRKKRELNDVVMKKSDFSYEWLSKHISDFNYSPIQIFDNVSYEEYINTFNKYLSNDGYRKPDLSTLHFTINKKDGTYVCKEYASSKTLQDCVKDDVLEYLKTYK